MINEKIKESLEEHLTRLLEFKVTPIEISPLENSELEMILPTTDGLDLRVSRDFGVYSVLMMAGQSVGQKVTSRTLIQRRLTSIEYDAVSKVLSEVWYFMCEEVKPDKMPLLWFKFEGMPGYLRIAHTASESMPAATDSRPTKRAFGPEPFKELRHKFDAMTRSQLIAQICKNLQHWSDGAIRDYLFTSTPEHGALLLRFVSDERVEMILKPIEPTRRDKIKECLGNPNVKPPNNVVIASIAFSTYPTIEITTDEEPNGDTHLASF